MKKMLISFILIGIFLSSPVFAGSYSLELNQEQDTLIANEIINGTVFETYTDFDSFDFSGRDIYLLKRIVFSEDFETAIVKINLEKGIIIKKDEIFPAEYEITTNGESISVFWNLNSVKKGDNFAIFMIMENINQRFNSYLIIGFILLLVLFAGGISFIRKFNKKIQKQSVLKKESIKKSLQKEYNFLLDTEKKVIDELKKANRNELWQRKIQDLTGFSKAKVSRLVRNLESRGLVVKIPFGNTNKIRLK